MIVRPAAAGDVAGLAGVAVGAYRAGFAGILEPEVLAGYDAAHFTARFAASLERIMVAEAAGLLGFSLTTGSHLDMLFVAPAAQGRGVGAALLAEARGRGVRSLESFAANAAARGFYERHGWRLVAAYEREFAGRVRGFVRYEAG